MESPSSHTSRKSILSDTLNVLSCLLPIRSLTENKSIEVQANNALIGTWATIATSINGAAFTGSGTISETGSSLKTVEVRDTVNITAGGTRFMRIRVTR